MSGKNLIRALPFSKEKELSTLVENRRAYTLDSFELNIYETYEASNLVPLQFNDMVIINMLKGKKVMHVNDLPAFDYYPGETIVLPALKPMQIDFPDAALQDPTQCTALVVSADKIEKTLNYLNESYPKENKSMQWNLSWENVHFANTSEIASLTDRLFSTMTSNDPLKDVLSDILFKELLVRIIQQQKLSTVVSPGTEQHNNLLVHIRNFITKNINDKLTIDQLSQHVNMSNASLFRVFKEEVGITPMELVIQERLSKAKELLKSKLSVKEVCYACGFSDVNYFVRMFRKREHMTPGNYQRRAEAIVS
ncbi:helix-turn-helix domain-containing protein [Sphingobacterium sp. DK4209]|uniref:Helix-turn-helix domain-containing protein n=1 Tax=Sphingobacterium zhuxiongii TaxID=2662364 RepID=A0A5Q0QDA6_9SPHI|nr:MULTISPECIES: helix-turn-helix domain-containing protein [unclassified Sphingobacterium]MVZ67174.1 helix-turn-helix domain-containing protein [Sphingobacterium sp. DK4209]QGA25512.1 helix-turn-helix domain-containing protein [Sphingobacterium sp. dk4302]